MSEGSLTLENHVIVTRGTGRYYMTKSRADNIFAILNSDSCPKMLDIDDNYVAVNDIVGIVSAAQIEDMEKRKRGLWQCGKGNWHERNEVCKCGWGQADNKKDEDREAKLTPEEKERAELIQRIRAQGLSFKDMIKLKGKTNEDLKQMIKETDERNKQKNKLNNIR